MLKIFYKRDYFQVKDELEFLEGSYEELTRDFAKLATSNFEKNKELKELNETISRLKASNIFLQEALSLEREERLYQVNKVKELEQKVRNANATKGGLTKSKNNLEKKVEELKKLLPKVRKLPPAVPRKSRLEMKTKRGVTNSGAKAILKSKNESEEKE